MALAREVRLRVRYHETDQGGVVYHAHYLYYFESGRTEFMREAGVRYRDLEDAGILLVVAEANLKYRASARYDDELLVVTVVTELAGATVRFGYQVYREPDHLLLVEGDTRLACIGPDKRPRRLPTHVVAALAPSGG
ncbi:MAG: acyl-CoA thioesterase [Planctomycetota bacterium]